MYSYNMYSRFKRFATICTIAAGIFPGLSAEVIPSPAVIADALDRIENYSAMARFSVSMPQLAEDVIYDVSMTQKDSPADPLGCDSYLLDWRLSSRDNGRSGFSAYFGGNHYRHSDERLQEYHLQWDSIPFMPGLIGSKSQGVHRSAQFFNMLPQAIAADLRSMSTDSAYTLSLHPDTLVSGLHVVGINARLIRNGITAMEAEYLFATRTFLPLRIRFENNPGSISEQSVYIDYLSSDTGPIDPITEPWLIQRYPDVFARFRESNFRIENLPGQRLPAFALPTTTGERYARRSSDTFRAPTIVALLDATTGFTPDVVAALRLAVDRLPFDADLIMAFTDNVADRVEAIVARTRPGEHLLTSAHPLIRDCGAASLPAIILVGPDGIVRNVILGYNNDLASDVIQKMALIK